MAYGLVLSGFFPAVSAVISRNALVFEEKSRMFCIFESKIRKIQINIFSSKDIFQNTGVRWKKDLLETLGKSVTSERAKPLQMVSVPELP